MIWFDFIRVIKVFRKRCFVKKSFVIPRLSFLLCSFCLRVILPFHFFIYCTNLFLSVFPLLNQRWKFICFCFFKLNLFFFFNAFDPSYLRRMSYEVLLLFFGIIGSVWWWIYFRGLCKSCSLRLLPFGLDLTYHKNGVLVQFRLLIACRYISNCCGTFFYYKWSSMLF